MSELGKNETASDVLTNQLAGQQRPTQPSREFSHDEGTFAKIWRGLQAGKYISKDEVAGGKDYHYWRHQLRDMTDPQLVAGLEATARFDGFLTWSEFRKLCKPKQSASHEYPKYPRLPNKLGNERFQELLKVTKAMKDEPTGGPIHKATLAGKLTKNFIRGKSAEEVIAKMRQELKV